MTAPPAYMDTIKAIDPVNDVIWGQSDPKAVPDDGTITDIHITMNHKLSQVKLVATTGPGGSLITAFDDVTMPGYTVNLTTFTGIPVKNTTTSQPFTFTIPTGGKDTVISNTRTVYTGGDIPTIVKIGSMTVKDTTLNNISATFAKPLLSGYSYTMTMRIGNSTNLTDDTPPAGFIPFVGAFWKSNQMGERLIHIPRVESGLADSVWTATVVAGADWIVLDKTMTSDPNVGWRTDVTPVEANVVNGNDPNFDTNYKVEGSNTYVSGFLRPVNSTGYQPNDENIYFRIGLKSTYNPTTAAPARYGLVLLTYNNNKKRQRIWIRQGEDADFLMRSTDPIRTPSSFGNISSRTSSRRFSPYNLTAKTTLNAQVDIPGTAPVTNPAGWVNYPSQAGAYFMWAHPDVLIRYAWDASTLTPIAWDPTMYASNYYWNSTTNAFSTNNETCPPGFFRPSDGWTDATSIMTQATNMANSEMRHSLYLDPQLGSTSSNSNSSWGYYADGFFDRRKIVSSINSNILSAVSAENDSVAYMGRLFYNPTTYASLFFPAAGARWYDTGGLTYTGLEGRYWTSSANTVNNTQYLNVTSTTALQNNDVTRQYGFPIRCVESLPVLTSITGFKCVTSFIDKPTILTYAANYVAGATYEWTLPANWTVVSADKNKITVQTGGLTQATGVLSVKASNKVGTSATINLSINYTPIAKFADTNLGADPTYSTPKSQMQYLATHSYVTTDGHIYGGIHQWGRDNKGDYAFNPLTYTISYATTTQALLQNTATYDDGTPANTGQILTYDGTNPAAKLYISDTRNPGYDWRLVARNDLWGNGRALNVNTNDLADKGILYNGNYYQSTTWAFPANNPCPPNYRVPTQDEWERLTNYDCNASAASGSTIQVSIPATQIWTATTTGFTWVRVFNGKPYQGNFGTSTSSANYGYALYRTADWDSSLVVGGYLAGLTQTIIDADIPAILGSKTLYDAGAPEPLLFLPIAKNRSHTNGAIYEHATTQYWSSTPTTSGGNNTAFTFQLTATAINSTYGGGYRSGGHAIRCIKDGIP